MSTMMNTWVRFAAVTSLTLGVGLAGVAHASSDRVTGSGGSVESSATVAGASSPRLAMDEVLARLRSAGYSEFREVEHEAGRYEIKGRNASGERVEIYVDAGSGEIMKEERDD